MTLYRTLLALHIISIICWMAGVLYLYRLFVYHSEETFAEVRSRFEVMEHRLYSYITVPAMYSASALGILMIYLNPSLMSYPWMHAKLFLVVLLFGITQMAGPFKRKLKEGTSHLSSKKFRILNEIPTLLMILIVLLVILKPF